MLSGLLTFFYQKYEPLIKNNRLNFKKASTGYTIAATNALN